MRGEFLFITIIKNSFARESAYDLLKVIIEMNLENAKNKPQEQNFGI